MSIPISLIRDTLQQCYPHREAGNIARIVCCEMFHVSPIDYYLGKDMILSPNEEKELYTILDRLAHSEPIQYIQGFTIFKGRRFKVTPDVLIPRPETEELVEWVLEEKHTPHRLLDIGTGSGCIAISLDKELPDTTVAGWDISECALRIAAINNDALQARVSLSRKDILADRSDDDGRYDIIVSNPPYVTESEKQTMEPNVLEWEPPAALFVPDRQPLLFYQKIAESGRHLLTTHGALFFEINQRFSHEVAALLHQYGYQHIAIRKDMNGNDRFVKGYR